MSPRNRAALLVVGLCLILAATSEARAENPVIRFYRTVISPADGSRCPMYPTCSTYARQVFEKHGPILGWIMTCDRLVRCGRDEARLSPHIAVESGKAVYDPVEANDFWWFEAGQ